MRAVTSPRHSGRALRYLNEVHGGAEVVAVVGQRQLHRFTDRLQPREVDHEVEPVLTTRSDTHTCTCSTQQIFSTRAGISVIRLEENSSQQIRNVTSIPTQNWPMAKPALFFYHFHITTAAAAAAFQNPTSSDMVLWLQRQRRFQVQQYRIETQVTDHEICG